MGRFKANVFSALGYSQENWQVLRDDLLALAHTGVAIPGQPSVYGRKYEVSGILVGPSGRHGSFITVWLVPAGQDIAKFVTAFPG